MTQTDESVKRLRDHWDFWLDLPTTPKKYIRVDDLEEGIGALETILLDKATTCLHQRRRAPAWAAPRRP